MLDSQWTIYDGYKYFIKNVSLLPNAGDLTVLNYAFGNIYPDGNGGFICDSRDEVNGNDGTGGDAWADYQKGFTAGESVDGVADVWNAPLAGNFNQIKKLKAMYPKIRALVALGGWSWSKWFSSAAASPPLRERLVSSCVDLYLRGNLPVSADGARGGIGVGAGVFDGFDIDWEYPAMQGIGYNVFTPADKQNFNLLLAEFRRQLDELAYASNKPYGLTAAVGAMKPMIDNTEPAVYSQSLDWIGVMTYDYHGAWSPTGPTNFHSNLYPDPAAPDYATLPWASTDSAVTYLLSLGVSPDKLLLGIPCYGRGWTGVAPGGVNGVYQAATGPAPGTHVAGQDDYKVLKSLAGTVFTQSPTQQSYKYDSITQLWWSYDTPAVVETKVTYAKSKALRGVFSWSIDGDTSDGELLAKMAGITV